MTDFSDEVSQTNNSKADASVYPPSPVPSDAHLEDDELPFTAFGQFGPDSMDLRVFEQDIYWVNAQGNPFRLDEMSQEYRLNVINFLFNEAEYLYVSMVKKYAVELLIQLKESGTGSLDSENPVFVAAMTMNEQNPVEWLNSTPLIRRLSALVGW